MKRKEQRGSRQRSRSPLAMSRQYLSSTSNPRVSYDSPPLQLSSSLETCLLQGCGRSIIANTAGFKESSPWEDNPIMTDSTSAFSESSEASSTSTASSADDSARRKLSAKRKAAADRTCSAIQMERENKEHSEVHPYIPDHHYKFAGSSKKVNDMPNFEGFYVGKTNDITPNVSLKWNHLTYRIDQRSSMTKLVKDNAVAVGGSIPKSTSDNSGKVILKDLSGHVKSGELMAIMGPSGAGKSTLLECLAGRRSDGISGFVSVTKIHGLRIAFISQTDHNHRQLTVRETLVYASRIKNCDKIVRLGAGPDHSDTRHQLIDSTNPFNRIQSVAFGAFHNVHHSSDSDIGGEFAERPNTFVTSANRKKKPKKLSIHEAVALKVAHQLGLDSCLDVKLCRCSGGQQKRVSIAVELVSTPHILILDEPTSGLDSSSCHQCISLLRQLAHSQKEPIAIAATIHQPSARVLTLFDSLYVLSSTGLCIYNGPTRSLLDYLSVRGLACPVYHNPADYVIELASGDYGLEAIAKLSAEHQMNGNITAHMVPHHSDYRSSQAMMMTAAAHAASTTLLDSYQRPVLKMIDRKRTFPTRSHLWILLCRTLVSSFREPFLTSVRLVMHIAVAIVVALLYGPEVGKEDGCIGSFAMINFTSAQDFHDQQIEKESRINANVALLFFCNLFIVFASMMPMALTFPMEMAVFIKEKTNHWYSCGSFFVAKLLADTPFAIIFPAMFITIVYYMTGQDPETWRFLSMVGVVVLVASICQSIGLMTGAIFVNSMDSAVFFAPLSVLPALLFSGFFVKIVAMPAYFQPLAAISYFRYGFESVMVIIYGYGRCDKYSLDSIGFERIKSLIQMQSLQQQQGLGSVGLAMSRNEAATTSSPIESTVTTQPPPTLNTVGTAYNNDYDDYDHVPSSSGMNASPDYSLQMAQAMAAFDRTESKALSIFGIGSDLLPHHFVVLIIFSLALRVIAYIVFLHRANRRN